MTRSSSSSSATRREHRRSDEGPSFATLATFLVLLVLCVNRFVDFSSDPRDAVEDMANKLRERLRSSLSSSSSSSFSDHDVDVDEEERTVGSRSRSDNSDTFPLTNYFRAAAGDDDDADELVSLDGTHRPRGGAVVAALVATSDDDDETAALLEGLRVALRSLVFLRDDDPDRPAPALVFHEPGSLDDAAKRRLASALRGTARPIAFPTVGSKDHGLPPGLDVDRSDYQRLAARQGDGYDARRPWRRHRATRFWLSTSWDHAALEPFETVMRLDATSCFLAPNDDGLPGLPNDDVVYRAPYETNDDDDDDDDDVADLFDHAERFLKRYKKSAGNPVLWRYGKLSWEKRETLPSLSNSSLEVSRAPWMRKNIVRRWHESLTEEKPHALFAHSWSEGTLRYLMAAMLAMNHEVDTSTPEGYRRGKVCTMAAVEKAISKHSKILFGKH